MTTAKAIETRAALFPELEAWFKLTGSNQRHIARFLDIHESQATEYMQKGWPVEYCLRISLLTGIRPEKLTKDRKLARILKLFVTLPTLSEENAND